MKAERRFECVARIEDELSYIPSKGLLGDAAAIVMNNKKLKVNRTVDLAHCQIMKTVTIIMAAILAAAVADAKDNRRLGSRASTKSNKGSYSMSSTSKSGKGSFSITSKSGKGSYSTTSKSGKGSYSYSMSYPPDQCDALNYAACVIYIVERTPAKFQQQARNGNVVGEFPSKAAAVNDVTSTRGYVAAGAKQQPPYSSCWSGAGTLVEDPVYFPDQDNCGNINLIDV